MLEHEKLRNVFVMQNELAITRPFLKEGVSNMDERAKEGSINKRVDIATIITSPSDTDRDF
jgi:hypothetical protein